MPHLFTFPDKTTANVFTTLAQQCDVHTRWIAVDPNPDYDHEWRFTDDLIFESVFNTTFEIINDALADRPRTKRDECSTQHKSDLIDLPITEWGYLGNNGPEPRDVITELSKARDQIPDETYLQAIEDTLAFTITLLSIATTHCNHPLLHRMARGPEQE